MLPVFPDCARTKRVNRSSARWRWSSVGGLSCSGGRRGDNAFLQVTPEVRSPAGLYACSSQLSSYGMLLCYCINPAAASESTADLEVSTSSQTQTKALNHRGGIDVDALVFVPHLWSGLAWQNQSLHHLRGEDCFFFFSVGTRPATHFSNHIRFSQG